MIKAINPNFSQSDDVAGYQRQMILSWAGFVAALLTLVFAIVIDIPALSAVTMLLLLPIPVVSIIDCFTSSVAKDNVTIKMYLKRIIDYKADTLVSPDSTSDDRDLYTAIKDNLERGSYQNGFNVDKMESEHIEWIEKQWKKAVAKRSAQALKSANNEAYHRLSVLGGNDSETKRVKYQVQAFNDLKEKHPA